MIIRTSIAVMATVAVLLASAAVHANEFGAFTQLAATGQTAPRSGGTFESFGAPLTSGPAYFQAQDSNGVSGVYAASIGAGNVGFVGTVVLADTTMPAPMGGTYSGFPSVATGGLGAALVANTTTGTQLVMGGITTNNLSVITETGDSPAPGETFGNFQAVSLGGIFPCGELISDIGIYTFGEDFPPATVASTPDANFSSTPVGASGPFTSFSSVAIVSPDPGAHNTPGLRTFALAIHGTAGGAEGIYYAGDGGDFNTPLSVLADTATPSIQHFTSFGDPVVTVNDIAFTAHYSTASGDQQGIFAFGPYVGTYIVGGPEFQQLMATGEVAPNSGGAHFSSFLTIAGYDVFTATLDNGQEGLYIYTGGESATYGPYSTPGMSQCILDTTDTLDGKSIADIELSSQGAGFGYETPIVFKVDFTDGSQAIYDFLPGVPEPASFVIPLLAMSLLRPYRGGRPCPNHRMA